MSSFIISYESISSNRLLCQTKVQQTVAAKRGVNVTMLPLLMQLVELFRQCLCSHEKKPKPQLSTDRPIGSLGLVHESGWMTSENFLAALVHFQSHVGATKERTVLILMDNHVSHMDFPLIE